MTETNPGRGDPLAIVLILMGGALLVVGAAGWINGQLSPLKGGGFALIGVGFVGNGVRRLRA